jgi:hypothetical protein
MLPKVQYFPFHHHDSPWARPRNRRALPFPVLSVAVQEAAEHLG